MICSFERCGAKNGRSVCCCPKCGKKAYSDDPTTCYAQCDSKEPGLIRKAANFTKATAAHVAAGRPEASDEQVAERFAKCQACPLFKATSEGQGRCTHSTCGCNLKVVGLKGRNKLRWADQKCPIGKWGAVTAV